MRFRYIIMFAIFGFILLFISMLIEVPEKEPISLIYPEKTCANLCVQQQYLEFHEYTNNICYCKNNMTGGINELYHN